MNENLSRLFRVFRVWHSNIVARRQLLSYLTEVPLFLLLHRRRSLFLPRLLVTLTLMLEHK